MASLATDANSGLGSLDTVLVSEICSFLPVVRSGLHFGHTSKQLNMTLNASFPLFCKRDFGITVGNAKEVCFPTFKTAVMCRDGQKEQGKMDVHPVGRTTSPKVLYRHFYKLHLLKCIAAGRLVLEGPNEAEERQEQRKLEGGHQLAFTFNHLAQSWERIYGWNVVHVPEIVGLTMATAHNFADQLVRGTRKYEALATLTSVSESLFDALFSNLIIQNGQNLIRHPIFACPLTWLGMFGGISCYDFQCSVRLLKAAEVDWCIKYGCENMEGPVPFALCNMSLRSCLQEHSSEACPMPWNSNEPRKCYYIDLSKGNEIGIGFMRFAPPGNAGGKIQIMPAAVLYEPESGGEISNLVRFFQHFGEKLESGYFSTQCLTDKYQKGIDSRQMRRVNVDPQMYSAFSRLGVGISVFPMHGEFSTTAITRNEHFPDGIQVTAHTTCLPGTPYGWAYSIRIKLLGKMMSTYNRCQLVARHWEIKKDDGRIEHVNGPGVIGQYPMFYSGGFINVGHGPENGQASPFGAGADFQYQSCTGRSNGTVSFGGEFLFRLVPPEEMDFKPYDDGPSTEDVIFSVKVATFPVGTHASMKGGALF